MWIILNFKCLYFFEKRSMIFEKQILNCGFLKKNISHISIFVKELLEIFRICWKNVYSFDYNTTKISIIFWQVWIGEIEKKMPKMIKELKINSKRWNFVRVSILTILNGFDEAIQDKFS